MNNRTDEEDENRRRDQAIGRELNRAYAEAIFAQFSRPLRLSDDEPVRVPHSAEPK